MLQKRWIFSAGAAFLVLAMVVGVALGNQYEFNQKVAGLHATWEQERRGGGLEGRATPLENSLGAMEQQSKGPVPIRTTRWRCSGTR